MKLLTERRDRLNRVSSPLSEMGPSSPDLIQSVDGPQFQIPGTLAVASSGFSVKSQTTLGRVSALWSREGGGACAAAARVRTERGGEAGGEPAGGASERRRVAMVQP
ncbi:hypothetical protein ACRRTK_012096 [Alexandromys fortis]